MKIHIEKTFRPKTIRIETDEEYELIIRGLRELHKTGTAILSGQLRHSSNEISQEVKEAWKEDVQKAFEMIAQLENAR